MKRGTLVQWKANMWVPWHIGAKIGVIIDSDGETSSGIPIYKVMVENGEILTMLLNNLRMIQS